jgi:hypothetical protein
MPRPELAKASSVPTEMIVDFEASVRTPSEADVLAMQQALGAAGVDRGRGKAEEGWKVTGAARLGCSSPGSASMSARAAAQATETIVSSTVRDLVARLSLPFEDRGSHALKGLPDNVHLYTVLRAARPSRSSRIAGKRFRSTGKRETPGYRR